jgi:hypothetical protein
MAKPTTDELKRMARETFGRELADAEADAYPGRLPTTVPNVQRLRELDERLDERLVAAEPSALALPKLPA